MQRGPAGNARRARGVRAVPAGGRHDQGVPHRLGHPRRGRPDLDPGQQNANRAGLQDDCGAQAAAEPQVADARGERVQGGQQDLG